MPRLDRGPIVLDTGPLLIYLAIPYLRSVGAGNTWRDEVFRSLQKRVALDQGLQERFETRLSSFSPVLTTTLVLGEVFRLRESSPLAQATEEFRRVSIGTVQRIVEVPVTLAQIVSDSGFGELICRFGLIDASILWLGSSRQCPILTDDERLFSSHTRVHFPDLLLLDNVLKDWSATD